MESPRFVLIPCRSCQATTVVIGDRRRPVMCARCRSPFDPVSATFGPRGEAPAEPLNAAAPRPEA
ncbi:MAG TPA: hypothetical protein VMN82_14535 [Thermoanaerobaculia bacterium]|nr:hypothetical protein [Thermoanaerobaculia bacterium]